MPKEVTVSSSFSNKEKIFVPSSPDSLGDLSLQDLSRKLADARRSLRSYDMSKADERLHQWEQERRKLNANHRARKQLARKSHSVLVKACAAAEQY